jgi:hypothetical protein
MEDGVWAKRGAQWTMAQVMVLPVRGDILLDARGQGRALRVSWHHEASIVVLSLWKNDGCICTFRLAKQDVPALIRTLVDGLVDSEPIITGTGTGA